MIAICPAGPPKLMNPSFSQNRNASVKDGCGASAFTPQHVAARATRGQRGRLYQPWRSVMCRISAGARVRSGNQLPVPFETMSARSLSR